MALIEGVGDEVTLLFGSLLLLMVLLLAWVSTRTAEPPEQLFPGHAPSPQDTPLSSTASVGDGAPSETPPTGSSPQEEAEPEAGDGVRRRGAERSMVVRLKFLNDTERMAQVQPHDTIGYIKRYGLSTNQRQEAGLSIANHPLGGAAHPPPASLLHDSTASHERIFSSEYIR
ncbi:PREDICTED: transmembrane and ubiquitin-like domain-containing protein 1 [Poecilia mexicana]|nr:PREDICTED: transmembrane and ubiquitin-like domain-containing protein 1 [Poecilia mexicana]XP_014823411.1 PREDICTED: transmembrane and ubiquitin-like domain-containing protein 1 [Poecilia mexicana]XP_014823412.1 PREDICTED: transmembrane and ubiquitin-like domain-containing protein 1 [Poecilia mexicana]